MDDAKGEHLQVHELVFAIVEVVGQRHSEFFLEYLFCLTSLARHPISDDRVHWMVGAAAIHADPAQLLVFCPIGKLSVRTGMHHHVANFVGGGHVPPEMVVAGVDDQDIPFTNFDPFLDHLARVYIVIPADITQVHYCGGMNEIIHFERGDILAGRVEVNFSVQMSSQVVGVGQHLTVCPIRCQAFKIFQL